MGRNKSISYATTPRTPVNPDTLLERHPEATDTSQGIKTDASHKRITKSVRMSIRHSEALRELSHEETRQVGERVSEADLIEAALEQYFDASAVTLSPRLSEKVMQLAHRQTVQQGRHVSVQEILDQALTLWTEEHT